MRRLALVLMLLLTPLAAQAAEVRLIWDANTEADLAGYELSWGLASRVYTQTQRIAKDATTTSVTLQPGRYYFALRAYNTADIFSGFSNEVTVVVTEPTTIFISIPSHTSSVTPP